MSRRAFRSAAVFAFVAAALVPSISRAKVGLQGQLTLSAGYTDNINGQPTIPAPGMVGAEADWFTQVTPRLVFTALTPRAIFTAAYAFDAAIFVNHLSVNSYTHLADISALIVTNPKSELVLDFGLRQGRANSFNLFTDPSMQPIGARPILSFEYWSPTARERFFWDISRKWRLGQELNFNSLIPVNVQGLTRNYEVTNTLSISRSWNRDALGIDNVTSYMLFGIARGPVTAADGTIDPNGITSVARHQVLESAVAKWLHDYTRELSHELNLGTVLVADVNNISSTLFQPAALAALRYAHLYGGAELSYAHNVTPNVLAGNTFTTDQVALRFSLPFGQYSRVALSGSGAFQYGRTFAGTAGETQSTVRVWLADVALSWAPRNEVGMTLRYSFNDQVGNPTEPAPVPTIRRHMFVFSISFLYPGQPVARIPSRTRIRADRGNEPLGIPAQHKVQEVGQRQ